VLYDTAVEALAQNVLTALGSRVLLARGLVGGEDVKTWELAGEMFDWFADAHADRDTVVGRDRRRHRYRSGRFRRGDVLLGRGLRWCAVRPRCSRRSTPLSAGKTAINLGAGKTSSARSTIPPLRAIDTEAFTTLDPRDIAAGVAEAVEDRARRRRRIVRVSRARVAARAGG